MAFGKLKAGFDASDADTLAASDIIGAILRTAAGVSLTSTGTALDVNITNAIDVDLDHTTGDSVQIGDGTEILLINADGSLNAVVTATDLDIRNLVFATDKVDASGSEVSLDAGTLAALESITVQNGAGASAVNIQDGGNSITVDGTVAVTQSTSPWVVSDAALANTAVLTTAKNVGATGAVLVSAQANRKYYLQQNLGNKPVYLGPSGVSKTTGFRLGAQGQIELRAGAAIAFHAVSEDDSNMDNRIMELA